MPHNCVLLLVFVLGARGARRIVCGEISLALTTDPPIPGRSREHGGIRRIAVPPPTPYRPSARPHNGVI